MKRATIGQAAAWPQAHFSSSAGYPNRAQVATQVTLSGDEGAAKIFRLETTKNAHDGFGQQPDN